MKLWHLFKYAELTEVARQDAKLFIDLLNKVPVNNVDHDVENLLKARLIREFDENYPKNASNIYAENEPALKINEAVLNNFPSELYTTEAYDKIPDNFKYHLALVQTAHNKKQTNTGGLAKLPKLKIAAKVMLTGNMSNS